MRNAVAAALGAALLAVTAAGCGGDSSSSSRTGTAATAPAAECPKAWRGDWQQIANRIQASVYCPSWMPPPLDGAIEGEYSNVSGVSDDRSYLVSFLFLDREAGGVAGEIHVNFRGYPGSTEIPTCEDTRTDRGKTTRVEIPCFSDPRGIKEVGGEEVTVYTVNQGIDQWHVLYAWEHDASLYTVSQHVIAPTPLTKAMRNLDRVMRGLERLEPAT
ncbi:MAG: hypothetical protein FJW96_05235 [Actinobacteria bacterium]|nr:hypothetical protein [Actinomycetota bacterium]